MHTENKFDITNFLFLDNYSIMENSFEFLSQEQYNLDDKKEHKKIFETFITKKKFITNKRREINQRENINEINTHDEKKNNLNFNNIFLKLSKPNSENNLYRKDALYKHFKVILGKYIKNRINELKNKCFPYYSKNNFSTPNYKYTGNPKEKDNFNFLHFNIKDILIYGKDIKNYNRQYNNELLIKFIEMNEYRTYDKKAYNELINFLNDKLENIIVQFYDDESEFNKLKNDSKCLKFDTFFKRETGISLLEKYGFIEALKKYNYKKEL